MKEIKLTDFDKHIDEEVTVYWADEITKTGIIVAYDPVNRTGTIVDKHYSNKTYQYKEEDFPQRTTFFIKDSKE